MKAEHRNLIFAIVCTLSVFFVMDYFFPQKKAEPKTSGVVASKTLATGTSVETAGVVSSGAIDIAAPKTQMLPIAKNVKDDAFVQIKSDTLSGQIRLRGGVFNGLTFLKYKDTVAKDSPDVSFLTPSYFAYMGVKGSAGMQVPDENTVWVADGGELTPATPVTLTWKNDAGVVFTRTITLDDKYMFTITDAVQNETAAPVTVAFDGALNRMNPVLDSSVSVHQGFVGVLNSHLEEEKYNSIESDKEQSFTSTGGWMGLTDKYWLAAFAFAPTQSGIDAKVTYTPQGDDKIFDARYQMPAQNVAPGKTAQNVVYFFAGPKELDLITGYQETLGIDRFELAIDFGWYYFLTKPFLYILSWLYSMVGNMGIAILIFATILRILLLPIAGKSFESMAKMRKLQPKMMELQKRYKNDKMRLNQETLVLYKKENVNPAAGCLPLFIQIPVFFSLYKVLSVSIEMRQAPFFGWIHDLSARDPSSVFTLFGLVPWPIPSFLNIGIWPVLMGITMYLQQKMNPQAMPTNPQAADTMKVMKWMPVIFTFMMGNFAAGLVIYWTWSNVLSIAQQRYVMHKYGVD